eukprot:m.751917 g.751917  ORF g.751917 m.751917 type:complete len:626 (+) comp58985_c0_seq28:1598-3475(+)
MKSQARLKFGKGEATFIESLARDIIQSTQPTLPSITAVEAPVGSMLPEAPITSAGLQPQCSPAVLPSPAPSAPIPASEAAQSQPSISRPVVAVATPTAPPAESLPLPTATDKPLAAVSVSISSPQAAAAPPPVVSQTTPTEVASPVVANSVKTSQSEVIHASTAGSSSSAVPANEAPSHSTAPPSTTALVQPTPAVPVPIASTPVAAPMEVPMIQAPSESAAVTATVAAPAAAIVKAPASQPASPAAPATLPKPPPRPSPKSNSSSNLATPPQSQPSSNPVSPSAPVTLPPPPKRPASMARSETLPDYQQFAAGTNSTSKNLPLPKVSPSVSSSSLSSVPESPSKAEPVTASPLPASSPSLIAAPSLSTESSPTTQRLPPAPRRVSPHSPATSARPPLRSSQTIDSGDMQPLPASSVALTIPESTTLPDRRSSHSSGTSSSPFRSSEGQFSAAIASPPAVTPRHSVASNPTESPRVQSSSRFSFLLQDIAGDDDPEYLQRAAERKKLREEKRKSSYLSPQPSADDPVSPTLLSPKSPLTTPFGSRQSSSILLVSPILDPQTTKLSFAELQARRALGPSKSGVDHSCLEDYLDDATFSEILGMSRVAFSELPKWKRDKIRSDKKLF